MIALDGSSPIFLFLRALGSQAVGYFAIVGIVFLVFWKLGARRFARARIPGKHRFSRAQLAHEIRYSLVTLAVGTLSAMVISYLYAAGHTRLTTDASTIGWPLIVTTFIGLLVFNDAWFYWWHRLLHHPRIFKRVHAVHHRSVDVNPFSSYSFHAVEGFLLGAWTIPVFLVIPMYLPMLGVLQAIGIANNVISHLGYELLPRWYVRVPPFKWFSSATYHSLHHTRFRGNYGLLFRFWDRLMGTEVPDYEATFVRRGRVEQPARPEASTATKLVA
jgi:sterol desaturase/sphingolipid hydroxylase (fatty acid hydroxylase superfamily)